jgi:hypothetical protein
MRYCPECGGEFLDAVTTCSACDKPLISEAGWKKIVDERQMENQETFVRVATAADQFEADVIRDALEGEQIPVLVRNYQDTSFNGLFIPQKGWGSILVPDEFRAKAQTIIEALEAARTPAADEDSGNEET